ncbi:MAG: hypothetical protein JW913_13715 [Chitinispirillaceae bacterium]|nr:hypothetical protein [Chitinispirillaceae bacterium]
MKLHHVTNGMMVMALTASVLFSGAVATTASDRDGGQRRGEPRNEQRDQKNQRSPSSRRGSQARTVYQNKAVVHAPSQRIIHVLPAGYRTIRTGDHSYYYYKGVFYNRNPHGYVIVGAPRFHRLPQHARRVVVNRIVYYVCDDVYYCSRGGYYEICEVPHVEHSIEFKAGPVRIVLTDSRGY